MARGGTARRAGADFRPPELGSVRTGLPSTVSLFEDGFPRDLQRFALRFCWCDAALKWRRWLARHLMRDLEFCAKRLPTDSLTVSALVSGLTTS